MEDMVMISREEFERLKEFERRVNEDEMDIDIVDDVTEGLKDIAEGRFSEI
tara:strand:+ start:332 stop:484 length:153 start_codon:yes stop_codon:yes gene_type:complete